MADPFVVRLYEPHELVWPLSNHDPAPRYEVGRATYAEAVRVDPFPAYPLSLELVGDLVQACWQRFPLGGARLEVAVLSHEVLERTNGCTCESQIFRRDDGSEWEEKLRCGCGCGELLELRGQALTIVLSAKRIPVHPAVVRYLVPHEYGHAAFAAIARVMGYQLHEHEKLARKYCERRGLSLDKTRYAGGHWHGQPEEIAANDFRVLLMQREAEFWPHPGVPMPPESIAAWWDEGLSAVSAALREVGS